MIYADYSFYRDDYGGELNEEAYNRLALKASRYIDRLTMNRAESYQTLHPEDSALKKACCAGAEQYELIEAARSTLCVDGDGEIASESVGGHSVSYRSGIEQAAALEAELREIISSYLALTGLLYRGCNYVHASHCYADIG